MKHFFKRLIVFLALIALGMAGILLVSNYDDKKKAQSELESINAKANPEPCLGKTC